MAGTVYLETNRFEVTLEGITFKTKDFQSLCSLDFLFPKGKKNWAHKPIVGVDIIRHPRNRKIILLLLCIGTGCVILRIHAGKPMPDPVSKFLRDERIIFVGFGLEEKGNLLSVKEICSNKNFVDVAYLAAKRFNDSKYKQAKLAELARKVLGIKKMVGLTDASSFERYEVIKCAICQLFITSVIGMALLSSQDKKKLEDVAKKMSSLLVEEWCNVLKVDKKDHLQDKKKPEDVHKKMSSAKVEEWCNVPKVEKKDNHQLETIIDQYNHNPKRKFNEGDQKEIRPINEFVFVDDSLQYKQKGDFFDVLDQEMGVERKRYTDSFPIKTKKNYPIYDSHKHTSGSNAPLETLLKGILKCPSTKTNKVELNELPSSSSSSTRNSTSQGQIRRANSKGMNVSFAFQLSE